MHKKRKKGASFLKKGISFAMGALMLACTVLGFSGCVSQEPDEYPDKEALKIAIVNYYDSDKDVEFNQAVVNEINTYLDNMGCEYKVEFSGIQLSDENFRDSDAYKKLKEADIVYAAPYSTVGDNKATLIDLLNALIDDGYAANLSESLDSGLKDAAAVLENYGFEFGDEVYSLPLNVQIPVSAGIKIEKELLDKSGFEPRALESFEDCAELFEKLYKANENDAFLFVDQSASTVGYVEVGYKTTKPAVMDYMRDYMFISASTAIDLKTGEAVNVYEEEKARDYIKTMYSYSDKGYTTGTSKDAQATFDIAVYPEPYMEKSGSDDEEDSYYYVLPIGDMISSYSKEKPTSGVCISANTQHMDWAERFINLVYSDEDFKRIIMFGDKDMTVETYLTYLEDHPRKGLNPTYAVPFMEMDEDLNNIYNYTDIEGNTITMEEIYFAAKEQAPESKFCIDAVDFQSLEDEIMAVDEKMKGILKDQPYIFANDGILSESDETTGESFINNETIDAGLDELSRQLSEAGGTTITDEINRQLGY